jgi:uncharacterized protein YbjT (DUF2867 family)
VTGEVVVNDVARRALALLRRHDEPLRTYKLEHRLPGSRQDVVRALNWLQGQGLVKLTSEGWELVRR